MYITNNPAVARIAEYAGVDWIFIDLEVLDKSERQKGLDTVQSHHTLDDIKVVKRSLTRSKLLVRCNHIYDHSEEEINTIIQNGAEIVMLPYFKTVEEVRRFISYVGGRAKTCLLLETPEAGALIDEILEVPGIDMIHIGLNDLSLALGMKFMFQPLAEGIVDELAYKIKAKKIPFGFGGLAQINTGLLPGSYVIKEHYRLGSQMVIVSRSFCNSDKISDLNVIRRIFNSGIMAIRRIERELLMKNADFFENNHSEVVDMVNLIVKQISEKKNDK